jgi:hypothetical protein
MDRPTVPRAGALLLAWAGLVMPLVVGVPQGALAHGEEAHGHEPLASPLLMATPQPTAATDRPPDSCSAVSATEPLPAGETPSSCLAIVGPDLLEATGIVLSVDSPALGQVHGFVLLTPEGEQLAYDTSELAFDPAFPVSHIAEHQMTSEPVRVTYVVEGDRLVVRQLGDAE